MPDFRRYDPLRQAAAGLSDLTVFAAVQKLMEGSLFYDPKSNVAADKIIDICQREQSRLLRMHDHGVAQIFAAQRDKEGAS